MEYNSIHLIYRIMLKVEGNTDYQKVYEAYAKNATKLQEFTGTVRSGDPQGFNKGDVISFPDDFKPLEVPVGTRKAQFFIVRITSEDGSKVEYRPFYPSQFSKAIYPIQVDADGKYVKDLPNTKPNGTAAEFYQSHVNQNVNDVMKELVKKGDVVVSNVEIVHTYVFGTKDITTTRKYTFDFVV